MTDERREDDQLMRLEEIETKEVSIVDRAANQKKFLVIKRAEATVANSTNGGAVEAAAPAPTPAPPATGVEKQEPKRTEDGKEFPASAYAYVPDRDKPSTWKLRLYADPGDVPSRPSIKHTAFAAAAISPGGFRGQRAEIPSEALPGVKAKIRGAWMSARRQAGQTPSPEDVPAILKEAGPEAAAEFEVASRLADQQGALEKVIADFLDGKTVETSKAEPPKEAPVSAPVSPTPAPTTEASPSILATSTTPTGEVEKVGRPMQTDRLNRLKGAISLLKEALSELNSGSASLDKFKKAAHVFASIVSELDVWKRIAEDLGEVARSSSLPSAPNVGSGVQPDASVVAGTAAIVGPGTPDVLGEILKRIEGLEKKAGAEKDAAVAKALSEKDAALAVLRAEVEKAHAVRPEPSLAPSASERARVGAGSAPAFRGWPRDMANYDPEDPT